MAEARIPVDVFNPGQVFACLGLMEIADILLDELESQFVLNENKVPTEFLLVSSDRHNPLQTILDFLATVEINGIVPKGWEPWRNEGDAKKRSRIENEISAYEQSCTFPAHLPEGLMSLPILLKGKHEDRDVEIRLDHWIDESGRNPFKLYSGNRSALKIASDMLFGSRAKPKKGQTTGELKTRGINQLYKEKTKAMLSLPFDVLTPIGGSFNFDPRGGWSAIDAGYSPDQQGQLVESSPFVEFMAACGLQHARPFVNGYQVEYQIWTSRIPLVLARTILGCMQLEGTRKYKFMLQSSGKNKIVQFSLEDH